MDIIRSVELESCILTKLTKPFVPVNLEGPLYRVSASRGSIHFFVRNKEALPCVRRYSWWVRAVSGGNVFFAKYRGRFGGSQMSGGGNHYFACNKEAFSCMRPWTQLSASPRTVHFRCMSVVDHVDQAAPRAQCGGRRRVLGRGRRGAGEDAAVDAHTKRSTTVHWFGCRVTLP